MTADVGRPGAGVTVIIATALAQHRERLLDRAIASARKDECVRSVIVVVNGAGYRPEALQQLRTKEGVRVEYLPIADQAAAQRRGREMVMTEFFCFLDDDDELLRGSTAARLECAHSKQADVVICNGYRSVNGVDTPYCRRQPAPDENLGLSILAENWFASCAPLFRTVTVGVEFFDGRTRALEWTLLAFKLLSQAKRFAFVPDFGFRINDTPGSLSKDVRGVLASPAVVTQMIALTRDPNLRRELRRRRGDIHHHCADIEISSGSLGSAWRHHVRSLMSPGGLAYLSFTGRLIVSMLRGRERAKASG